MNKQQHTSCKDCIFAEYEDITQTGCKLDKIQAYKDSNIPVMECYDEEREFYVIPGRICMSKRPDRWAYANASLEKQKEQIEKEIRIKFLAIVRGNDNETDSIKRTLNSLYRQRLMPVVVSVIRPPAAAYSMKDIDSILSDSPVEWRIQRILDPELEQCLWEDLVVDSVKQCNFYSVFNAGFEVPENFFEDINDKVHNHLLEFGALTANSGGNGWTVPRIVYDYFMGNKQFALDFKLKELECPTIPVTNVVKNFPQ